MLGIFRNLSDGTIRNISANYIGQFMSIAVPLIALPYYLSMLGKESWGLISLSVLIQGLLGIFGAGMNQAIVREVAIRQGETDGCRESIAQLLQGLEHIYCLIGLVCASAVIIFSSELARLLIREVPEASGAPIIMLSGLVFLAQFLGTPYKAILNAAGRQVQANRIMLIWLLCRHATALCASYLYGTAIAYLVISGICMALEFITYRIGTWKWLGIQRSKAWHDVESLRKILKSTGPLTASVVVSILTMQIDKWTVAAMLPTDVLGMYTIATTLGFGVLNLFVPLANAYQPLIIRVSATANLLRELNIKLLKLFGIGVLSLAIGYVMLGNWILHTWLRNEFFADQIFPVVGVLLLGSALNAMYNIGYMNWLAHGETRKIFRANLMSFFVVLIAVPFATKEYGMVGAAFGWVLSNAACFILSLDWFLDRPRNVKLC